MSLDRVSERLIAELRALLPDVPEWHSKSNPAAREWMITGSVGEGENEVRWSCTVAPEDDERPSKAPRLMTANIGDAEFRGDGDSVLTALAALRGDAVRAATVVHRHSAPVARQPLTWGWDDCAGTCGVGFATRALAVVDAYESGAPRHVEIGRTARPNLALHVPRVAELVHELNDTVPYMDFVAPFTVRDEAAAQQALVAWAEAHLDVHFLEFVGKTTPLTSEEHADWTAWHAADGGDDD